MRLGAVGPVIPISSPKPYVRHFVFVRFVAAFCQVEQFANRLYICIFSYSTLTGKPRVLYFHLEEYFRIPVA